MDEFINRQAAIEQIKAEWAKLPLSETTGFGILMRVLTSIPAADVRPVVTCGKCKYGKYTGTEWFCDKHSGHADKFGEDASYHEYHSKYWFCADGEERKHE